MKKKSGLIGDLMSLGYERAYTSVHTFNGKITHYSHRFAKPERPDIILNTKCPSIHDKILGAFYHRAAYLRPKKNPLEIWIN